MTATVGDDVPGGTVRVLLVDDDERWARTNARLLDRQREAFAVTTAPDLAGAVEAYGRLDPDCVVSDYQLGDGTGLDLLRRVREDDPDRPFVLVTGRGNEAVASDAIGRGVTDYVRKSAVAERTALLARRVATAVRAHRTARALERERRSKEAMLDIVTATTSREGLARDFCRHLVAERGYAAAWLGTYAPSEGVIPRSVAGDERYLDAVVPPGTSPDAADEPALAALADDAPRVVALDGDADADADAAVDAGRDDPSTDADAPDPATAAVDGADPTAWRAVAAACGFRVAAAVPVTHEGATIGVLAVYDDDPDALDPGERALLVDYGTTIGFAIRTAEWKQSLVSTTPVTAEVTVRGESVPLVALCRALPAGTTLTVRTAVLLDDRLLYVVDVEPQVAAATVRTAAADADAVASVSAGEASGTRWEVTTATGTTAPERLAVDCGGRFVETVATADRATVSFVATGRDAVATFTTAAADRYDDLALVSLRSDGTVDDDAPLDDLTAKQRGALELAYHEGYFERPRRNNATEVAGTLGVSRATFTQHLRAAERKLLDRLLDGPG